MERNSSKKLTVSEHGHKQCMIEIALQMFCEEVNAFNTILNDSRIGFGKKQ